jgi:hypothetical protein
MSQGGAAAILHPHRPSPATEPPGRESDPAAVLAVMVLEQAVRDLRGDTWLIAQARRSLGHSEMARRIRQDAEHFLSIRLWEDGNLWGAWLRELLPPRPVVLERVADLRERGAVRTPRMATPIGEYA